MVLAYLALNLPFRFGRTPVEWRQVSWDTVIMIRTLMDVSDARKCFLVSILGGVPTGPPCPPAGEALRVVRGKAEFLYLGAALLGRKPCLTKR